MTVAQTREEKKTVAGTRWYIVHAYTNFARSRMASATLRSKLV
jgi:transcription termination/antitermination protein NusG